MPGSRLPSLTGLRWAAAMLVFAEHVVNRVLAADVRVPDPVAGAAWALFSHAGALGVSFFFALSGFVLAYSARHGDTRRAFWRRRWAKIYPLHVVTALLAAALLLTTAGTVTPWQVLANVTLTQAWIPDPAIYTSLNPVSWSLSCEALFYLCFPFLLPALRHMSTIWLRSLILALPVVVLAINVALIGADHEVAKWTAYLLPAARLVGFTLGVVVAVLVTRGEWRGPGLGWSLILLAVVYAAAAETPYPVHLHALTLGPVVLVIAAAATADRSGVRTLWSRPALVYMGEVSFAFYMIHYLVLLVADQLGMIASPVGPLRAVAVTAVVFATSLAGAVALHHGVENPAYRRLKGQRT
ncbi:acyltransferase [Longispora sp. NPDC051575]|uniref:acyltransferase family protein n=1 Tax=Longispora sp. NPDC051575 TaxID=3154943 RepID=UPI00341DA66A